MSSFKGFQDPGIQLHVVELVPGAVTVLFKKMCLAFIYEKLVILRIIFLSIPYLKFPASLSVHVKWHD
jgi:hypothetical protein